LLKRTQTAPEVATNHKNKAENSIKPAMILSAKLIAVPETRKRNPMIQNQSRVSSVALQKKRLELPTN